MEWMQVWPGCCTKSKLFGVANAQSCRAFAVQCSTSSNCVGRTGAQKLALKAMRHRTSEAGMLAFTNALILQLC